MLNIEENYVYLEFHNKIATCKLEYINFLPLEIFKGIQVQTTIPQKIKALSEYIDCASGTSRLSSVPSPPRLTVQSGQRKSPFQFHSP